MTTRVLHSPRYGPGVCVRCFNLTRGFTHCFACCQVGQHLSAMVAISYSVGGEYLHHLLADYKRASGARAQAAREQVGALLGMFLERHERCLAEAADVPGFGVVTTVPSSDRERDRDHPLAAIVGSLGIASPRQERLLARTPEPVRAHTFNPRRFSAVRSLKGEHVLLIDDTWTTGANVQSAAAALRAAGAGTVSAVVVGRHVHRDWHENDAHLNALPFDWSRCALCAELGQQPGSPEERQEHSAALLAHAA